MKHRHALQSYVRWFSRQKKSLLPALAIVIVGLGVLSFGLYSSSNGFGSPEVKFTDASHSGLAIVPASGASATPLSPYCHAGETLMNSGTRCAFATSGGAGSCPAGYQYNANTGRCFTTPGCFIGYSYDGAGTCNFTGCPNGTVEVIGPSGNLRCSGTFTPGPSCPAGWVNSTTNQCEFIGCPAGYTISTASGLAVCVLPQCPSNYSGTYPNCIPPPCPQGYGGTYPNCFRICTVQYICNAGNGQLYLQNANCSMSASPRTPACQWGCTGSVCKPPPAPQVVTFDVSPTLIKSGSTSAITWKVLNATSCTVTGTNGDGAGGSWSCSGAACDPATPLSRTSKPIVGQTIYTLHCSIIPGAQNANGTPASPINVSATVNVLPGFNEQ